MIPHRPDIVYGSTKTYTHSVGLSACFRQWRAESHCRLPHGYALQFTFEWEAVFLDMNNWVQDFGGLKPLKAWLENMFDHKLLIASDDPLRAQFADLWINMGAEDDIRTVIACGCEAFARMAFEYADHMTLIAHNGNVVLNKVECREHGGNSAYVRKMMSYSPDMQDSWRSRNVIR